MSCRLCFKQVGKLEQTISRQGKDIKDPEVQLDLVRNVRGCLQKHVEQRDVQLALLDQHHDSAKKEVQTSTPISSGQCPEILRLRVRLVLGNHTPSDARITDVRVYLLNLFPTSL